MSRFLAVLYGVLVYLIFFATFLYLVGFVGNLWVPKGIDGGQPAGLAASIAIDLGLIAIFAVQHSLMARPAFKRRWIQLVPEPIERSTYVLFSSLSLILLCWQWRPLPHAVWTVTSPVAVAAIWAVFALGWAVALLSTFLISHFDLFGLKQVWAYGRKRIAPPSRFLTPLFYRVVRHPLYLGFLMSFWATPTMSVGRLLFATGLTLHVLVAIQMEESDLIDSFGDTYRGYRKRVSMLIPMPPRR